VKSGGLWYLSEVEASPGDFPEFTLTVMKRYAHHVANNPRNITEEDLEKIYESAF
jgi:alcohol dehydrogenase class IV